MNPIIGFVVEGVTGYFKDKREEKKAIRKQKIAGIKRTTDMIQDASHPSSDIDLLTVKQKDWIQNITLFVGILPLILAFIGYEDVVKRGFTALEVIPKWHLYGVGVMLGCVWGLRRMSLLILQVYISKAAMPLKLLSKK